TEAPANSTSRPEARTVIPNREVQKPRDRRIRNGMDSPFYRIEYATRAPLWAWRGTGGCVTQENCTANRSEDGAFPHGMEIEVHVEAEEIDHDVVVHAHPRGMPDDLHLDGVLLDGDAERLHLRPDGVLGFLIGLLVRGK